jgi:hypothetical protein
MTEQDYVETRWNWLEAGAFLVLGVAIALLVVVVALLSHKIRVLEQKPAT